jgi:hypothetical protein
MGFSFNTFPTCKLALSLSHPTSKNNQGFSAIIEAMKIDLSDEEVKLIVEALEHYYAYTRAAQRDDSRYQELADKLKKKR